MQHIVKLIAFLVLFSLTACVTTQGSSPSEKRQSIQQMKSGVLQDLYKVKPDVRSQIASAPGYAVFSNANINLVLASFGGGYGVVHNNRSGQDTYMKMGEVGVGLGLGAKDFRAIFVFHTAESLKRFVEDGWAFGAQADAAAKADDKGGAVGGEVTVDNITIYQLTETGLALQVTLKGTKYWKDANLN